MTGNRKKQPSADAFGICRGFFMAQIVNTGTAPIKACDTYRTQAGAYIFS